MHVMHKLWHFWLNTLTNYRNKWIMDFCMEKNKWRTKALLNITHLHASEINYAALTPAGQLGCYVQSWLWDCWVQYSKGSWTENNSSLESSFDSQFSLSSFLILLLFSSCCIVNACLFFCISAGLDICNVIVWLFFGSEIKERIILREK